MPLPDYPRIEALLLAQVRLVSGYNQDNAYIGKWGILNNGKSARYAILRPGAFSLSYGSARVDANWNTVIEFYHKYLDDGTSVSEIEIDVRAIIQRLILYPLIGDTTGTVVQSAVSTAAEPLQILNAGGGPVWYMQALTVVTLEECTVTYEGLA